MGRRNKNTNLSGLTLSWPAGHKLPTYKESFQVRWGNSIPLFLHAAIYLEVYLFRWMLNAMLHSSIAHNIICTRLFRGKMHSDWFNGIDILQGRWQHGEKLEYCYPSGLEKTLCKWEVYVPLVTKGLTGFKSWNNFLNIQQLTWNHVVKLQHTNEMN
jgi:hypothetical protein